MEPRSSSWTRLEADFDWRVPLVVLGAGSARRMGPANAGRSKVLIPIRPGDPAGSLLDGIVGAWERWASELVLVVREVDADIERLIARQPLPVRACVQAEPTGTSAALLALVDQLPARFLVVLGDCLLDGRLVARSGCFPGIGVWPEAPAAAVRANYGVRIDGDRVRAVEEKPSRVEPAHVCGLGIYFLDRAVLTCLARQQADSRGRLELTDGLRLVLSQGIALKAVELQGRYVNINAPGDLDQARAWFGAP